MRLLLLFLCLHIGTISFSQLGMGQWKMHVPTSKAIDVYAGNNKIYTAFEKGVFEYDLEAKEYTSWNVVNGLSDIDVTSIYFSKQRQALYIGYENGNFDVLKDNRVLNVPAIKNAQYSGLKSILKITENNGLIYLATSFSVVVYDPVKEEIKDTWYPTNKNFPIVDVAFLNDSVYALSSTRLYKAKSSNPLLANYAAWTLENRLDTLNGIDFNYKEIETFNNRLFYTYSNTAYGQDSVFMLTNNGHELLTDFPFSLELKSLKNEGDQFLVTIVDGVMVYNSNFELKYVVNQYNFVGYVKSNAACFFDNYLWIADNEFGLVKANDYEGFQRINFQGPPKQSFFALDHKKNQLAVVGGGISGVVRNYNRSGLYLFNNENWSVKDRFTVNEWDDSEIYDYLAVSIHPSDPSKIAVGTFSEVPLTILKGNDVTADTFTINNSPLERAFSNYKDCFISSVDYDENGNLWLMNAYADKPLKVYTNEGVWQSFDLGASAKQRFTKKVKVDYSGNKWCSVAGVGLIGYNDNGTINDPSDDKKITIDDGLNSGNLPSTNVNAIAVDLDNEIWIGTEQGFGILYNPDNSFDAAPGDYNIQQSKIVINGIVNYVLGKTSITDIEVDGGNRKWFGTSNGGIVLISADGSEIIQQFNTDNSPLISNVILDLAIDQTTGELFIATDRGLVSFRADASYEDAEYNSVTVFPNPSRPDYSGPITIQGIRYNSDVKITDIAGNLVYKTQSNGGTATWNGKNLSGERVATGVYLIWTANNDGDGRKVGKVLVFN